MTSGCFIRFRWLLCISLLGCSPLANAGEASPATTITATQQRANEESARQVRIGNSSLWIAKYQYDELINKEILPDSRLGITLRGPITRNDVPVLQKLLAPYLDKNYFKKNPKPKWYEPNAYDKGYLVFLDSEGGEMYAAMTIGRMFRKARVYAWLSKGNKCMSACVLLLAGAVDRSIQEGAAVGIHRPYSTDTNVVSFDEAQTKTTRLGVDVAAYLSEMNITNTLYDNMKQIPSESMKILSYSELAAFGLNGKDPVFAELKDNAEAKLAGISKREFLSRKALSEKCQTEGFQRLKPSIDSFADLFEFNKMVKDCDLKTIYKDVVDENGEWRANPSNNACIKLIEATTAAIEASDWRRLLEVATNRERNCANNMTVSELAESINDQADAYLELGNPQEAINVASRCMSIAIFPECHLTKGKALLSLSRSREGIEEIKIGKRLADQIVIRLSVELQKASESEAER